MSKVINFNDIKNKAELGIQELLDLLGYSDKVVKNNICELTSDVSLIVTSNLSLSKEDLTRDDVLDKVLHSAKKLYILTDGVYYELVMCKYDVALGVLETATISNTRAKLDNLKIKNISASSYNIDALINPSDSNFNFMSKVVLGATNIFSMALKPNSFRDEKLTFLRLAGVDVTEDDDIDRLYFGILQTLSTAVCELSTSED